MQTHKLVTALILAVLLSVFTGKALQAGEPGPKATQLFHSLPGDLGEVSLLLQTNKTFILELYILDIGEFVRMEGVWTENEDAFSLTFTENRPQIETLFEPSLITGRHTFEIPKGDNEMVIWGMVCDKVPVAQQPTVLSQNK